MKINLYTQKATLSKEVSMPKELEVEKNSSLLSQAIRVYEDRNHIGLAKVKTRAEIVRTKKKWYKQKGTGGARHGAKSAPIFVGGGVAHGPKGVSRVLAMPSKMKKLALKQAIRHLIDKNRAVLVTDLAKVTKTTEASKMLSALTKELKINTNSKVLMVLSKKSYEKNRFFKNIKNLKVVCFDTLNAYLLVSNGFVFFEDTVFEKIYGSVKKEKKAK